MDFSPEYHAHSAAASDKNEQLPSERSFDVVRSRHSEVFLAQHVQGCDAPFDDADPRNLGPLLTAIKKVSFEFLRENDGGGEGIRTPGTLRYGGFQNRCLRPLGHSSKLRQHYSISSVGGLASVSQRRFIGRSGGPGKGAVRFGGGRAGMMSPCRTSPPIPSLIGGALLGLSATLMLVLNGRVAGPAGILGGMLLPKKGDVVWRALFVGGLLAGGAAFSLARRVFVGAPRFRWRAPRASAFPRGRSPSSSPRGSSSGSACGSRTAARPVTASAA
jgi:hypothetical protein